MRHSALLVVLPVCSLFACGGDTTEPQQISYIDLGPETVILNALGDSVRLYAATRTADGSLIMGSSESRRSAWHWQSSDERVATVTSWGRVTAAGNGTATITVSTEGLSASVNVPVHQIATSVVVTPVGASVSGIGASQEFTADVRDANGYTIVSPAVTWTSLNTDVATIDDTGNAAAVASGQVTLAAEVDFEAGYAVLTVSVPGVAPVASWSVVSVAQREVLHSVWGSSPTNVFAVGEHGTVLRYDGIDWSAMQSATDFLLGGVWGTSSDRVFAVGGPIIQFYDGTDWRWVVNRAEGLWAVWGSSPSDVYAVGWTWAGVIRHYDGTAWRGVLYGAQWKDVWGTASSDVFVVGGQGTILRSDGTDPLYGWSDMTSGTTENLLAVWGTSPNDIFAVGDNGTILHYDGSAWTGMASGTAEGLNDVWGTSGSDVYAVGENGTIVHHDGLGWTPMASGTVEALQGVWGTSSGDVYVVGIDGAILRGSR